MADKIKQRQQVNELFESQRTLEALQSRYADPYDFMPVGYINLDSSGNIAKLNHTAASMLAKESSALCDTPFSTYLAAEDVNRFNDYLQDISKGEKSGIELRIHQGRLENLNVRLDTVQMCHDTTDMYPYLVAIIDITEEKAAKRELQRREGEFRLITDNLPLVIAYIDNQQHYRYNNKTYEEWFGYTPEDAYGRHIKDMFGDATYQKVERYIKTVLSGEKVSFEIDISDNKNCKRHLHVTYVPHLDDQDEVLGFFVLGNDITKRIEVEETLKKERDFAESLIAIAQMIVLELDPQGRIVSINPYLEELSGYRQHEVVGKDWFSTFLLEDDHNKVQNVFDEAITGTGTKGKINPILTRDGELRYIEWYDTTLKDKHGNITGLLAVGQDITWHINMQELLQASEARYRLLAENSTDMITRLDSNGIYLYVSPSSRALQGFEPEDLTGESFYKYVHPDDLNLTRQNFEKVLQHGENVLSTLRFLHKNGHYLWVEINSAPLKENGITNEIISFVRNITEQRNIELQEKKIFSRASA